MHKFHFKETSKRESNIKADFFIGFHQIENYFCQRKIIGLFQKVTPFLFVFLYILAMLRPISPFVEYAINYDYISKILCINKDKPEMSCNGKCQLMQKLEEQQEKDFQSLRIQMDEYPIGFVKFLRINSIKNDENSLKNNHYYKNQYSYLPLHNVFHPPTS